MARHRLIRHLLLSYSAASAAFAAPGLSLRALLLTPEGPVVRLYPMSGEKIDAPVEIGSLGLSAPFSPPTREFSLAIPDKSAKSGYRSVARILLPPDGRDFITLLEPAGAEYKVHVVSGKEPRFIADSTLFFNASDGTVGVTLGENKVVIKSHEVVFAKAPPKGEKPFYQVTFYQGDGDDFRMFSNVRWPHRSDSRVYVFLYRDDRGSMTYEAVDETITAE